MHHYFMPTPAGFVIPYIHIIASETGIKSVLLAHQKHLEENPNDLTMACAEALGGYFAGQVFSFDLPLEDEGTPFQKQVWGTLRKIGFGETWSYQDTARAMGLPKHSRAVGGANNKNPILIITPCHRVIGSDGRLVGYGGGIEVKKWLLEHEKKILGLRR
ncbi:hypothetical protein BJI48_04070 [Helicobacter sp. 11S02596-1]|nr:hypothetical protein BJI48_04070 [Helicobacter sp. 11S02596-1]